MDVISYKGTYCLISDFDHIAKTPYLKTCFMPGEHYHKHLFYELSVCLKGDYINEINDIPITFNRGKCAVVRPGEVHRYLNLTNGDLMHVDVFASDEKIKAVCDALSPNAYELFTQYGSPVSFYISNDNIEIFRKKTNLINSLQARGEDSLLLETMHSSLLTMLICSFIEDKFTKIKSMPEWINSLLDNLNTLDNLIMPEPEVAAKTGYSVSHFSREFKKYMGISYIQFINQKKIYYAADLLVKNNCNILEIAQMLGYSNQSAFNKQFYGIFGCSPRQYRKQQTT